MTYIQTRLFELKDEEYKKFHSALIPNIDADLIIGVRTPALKKLAQELKGTEEAKEFLNALPHKYYEENNLHAFLIASECDFEKCLSEVESFLPFIDNWATCDGLSPKVFAKEPKKLGEAILRWLNSEHTYTIRYGIVSLMRWYLKENFKKDHFDLVKSSTNDEYYVKMASAWYFATAMAFRYDETVKLLTENRLDKWTHNKTIQKAVESNRITLAQKQYLKTLRRK